MTINRYNQTSSRRYNSSSGSSFLSTIRGSGSSARGTTGFGEDYERETEQEQQTLEYNERYDVPLSPGPRFSQGDLIHPYSQQGRLSADLVICLIVIPTHMVWTNSL